MIMICEFYSRRIQIMAPPEVMQALVVILIILEIIIGLVIYGLYRFSPKIMLTISSIVVIYFVIVNY